MFKISNLTYGYGHLENFNPDVFEVHEESVYEILLFISGKASFSINERFYPLSPYDLIIIPPHHYHKLVLFDSYYYERAFFHFQLTQNDDETLTEFLSKPKVFNIKNEDKLMDLFARFNEYRYLYDSNDCNLMMTSLLTEFLLLLKIQSVSAPVRYSFNPTISKILRFVFNNLDTPFKIEDVAKSLNLSASHVKNIFSKHMKVGLKSYINNMRILRAQQLIQSGLKPTAIYLQCGFDSYATFFREYKIFTSKTPSADGKIIQ